MKPQLYLLIFYILTVLVISGSLLSDTVYAEPSNRENADVSQSEYNQKPIAKVKEKNVKIRVAISRFEDKTQIEGSPFNIEEEVKESGGTPSDTTDYSVTVKIDRDVEEEKIPKKEILIGLLTDALHDTGMFEVVERKEINELIHEINFQNSKWVEKENINTLGNIFGVQYIISGDVLRNDGGEKVGRDYYTLAIRMYNVNTSEIISSSAANAPYFNEAVNKVVNDLATQIKSKAWTCRVIGIGDTGIHINAGLKDDLEQKDVFHIYRIAGEIIDSETKETLGFNRKKIALIKIDEVLEENLSSAKILEKYEKISIGDIVSAERIDEKKKSELDLWRKIYGKQNTSKDISDKDFDKYSLTSYDLSPENIMANFGKSVVKIQSNEGMGSGFIVSADGYVVTNFHVVKDSAFINVKMIERNKYFTDVELIKVNPARDIALLKIDNISGLPCVVLGDSNTVNVGERVIAIGNPEGLENTISDGLVSGIRDLKEVKLIQTSVPITHGSSGGPLLNMRGEVIGVVTAGFGKEGNINFAIPINYVKEELLY